MLTVFLLCLDREKLQLKFYLMKKVLPAILVLIAVIFIWWLVCKTALFPAYALPSPGDVFLSFKEELMASRLLNDVIA